MKKLSDIFTIRYGNKFDMNKMTPLPIAEGGINFVGRSSRKQGVRGTVAPFNGVKPYESGLITVALGGRKVLSSFLQERPFYTAQNVAVLQPKAKLTKSEKIFICMCIRSNRYRYSTCGREANRTLRDLLVPDPANFPAWLGNVTRQVIEGKSASVNRGVPADLDTSRWKPFAIDRLFQIKKGLRLTKANMTPGSTPFIGAININNGVSHLISQPPLHTGNTLTVSYNGSVAEAFYQPVPYRCSDDVNVLYPNFTMTPAIGLFIATLIRREKYRFNYGRKWHLERMEQSLILLPADSNGNPDWDFMDRFIGSLPYSSQL